MVIKSTVKTAKHPYDLKKAVEKFERGYLINVLQISSGSKARASEMLCIRSEVLERKMKKYRIIF